MQFTLRERMHLFRLAWTGFGQLDLALVRVTASANGLELMPRNCSFSVQPVTGRVEKAVGPHTQAVYPEGPTYSHWPWTNGDPQDGDGGE